VGVDCRHLGLLPHRLGSVEAYRTGDQPFADTPEDKSMNLTSPKRPLLVGLALTGTAGAAVAVTLAVAGPSAPHTPASASTAQASPAGAPPSTAAAAAARPAAPVTSTAPAVAAPAAPTIISPDQARAIAARAGNGQADQIQADRGPTGISYDVSVTRSDGTDVEVILDGHTGRILSTVADTQDPADTNAPDPQDGIN
jgi:uncharacterized membrane protein YkoI